MPGIRLVLAALCTAVASCTSVEPGIDEASETRSPAITSGSDGPVESDVGFAVDLLVDVDDLGIPIDPRLRGTNVPAWLGAERLGSDWLRAAIAEAGVTQIRMPGGSWSNGYGWSACELGTSGCIWDGAARPADYADLLTDTGAEGMWTLSANETAESAAALVAYFNGATGDRTVIGSDRNGVDWGTVGEWADLRAANGTIDPVGVSLWEVGNEVFAGAPDRGGDACAPFGWEDVWTCDGAEYVDGNDAHDGYLAIRAAMVAIDPTVEVGAVGVGDPTAWSGWGADVIDRAGDELDFYALHAYAFDASPDPVEVAGRTAALWPSTIESARGSLPADVPVAVTEYNLVSYQDAAEDQSMVRAVNGLFIADTIGQLATLRVGVANQWNLANGTSAGGTDYGLVDAETGRRHPQFVGFSVWGRAGASLLPAETSPSRSDLRVYATRRTDGSLALIVIHSSPDPGTVSLAELGLEEAVRTRVTTWSAEGPDARSFRQVGPVAGGTLIDPIAVLPWSIMEVEVLVG